MEILIEPIEYPKYVSEIDSCNVDIGCIDVDVCVPDN